MRSSSRVAAFSISARGRSSVRLRSRCSTRWQAPQVDDAQTNRLPGVRRVGPPSRAGDGGHGGGRATRGDAEHCSSSTTRSTSSTRAARRAFPRVQRSPITAFYNNGYVFGELLRLRRRPTASACGCSSTTASGWCWAILRRPRTARAVVLPGPAFEPEGDAAGRSQQERCTSLYGVPTMFIAELDHPEFSSFELDSAAHRDDGGCTLPDRGDAPASRSRWASRRGCADAFGMTETSPVSTQVRR